MNYKRRHDETANEPKKVRPGTDLQAYSTSDEWPVYNHPEGGIVKITPWGSLRQYTNPLDGQMVTKFEDKNFQDHSFHQSADNGYVPSTPQSMCPASDSLSPSDGLHLSPSNEVESYVMEGYHPTPQSAHQEFSQEHENYFGMGNSEEEADCTDASNDQMMM
ncbi:hypothetical protein ABC855_g540 [[Candida] zeylanoides]